MKSVKLTLILLGLNISISNVGFAAPNSTYGYFKLPNSLFDGPALSFGSTIQTTTAENNPDLWCNDQGNGYRTPYASDMNEAHLGVVPFSYPANSLTGTNERKASLSLFNEWGDVTQYPGSGWDERDINKRFWVAEPSTANERYSYEPQTGLITSTTPALSNHVVCVADIN